jgi:hypothetical protein
MRNLILAGTTGLFLACGASGAFAGLPSPPDAACEAIASADLLVEGRAAYEVDVSAYGALIDNFRPSVNYGAPARAEDFSAGETIIRE